MAGADGNIYFHYSFNSTCIWISITLDACWYLIKLQKSYCLEDHLYTWEYLFGANGKVSSLLRGWRFDLKTEYYTKITEDWERFWKLDPRVDTYHFGALLIYWGHHKNVVYLLSLALLLELSSYITSIIFLYTLIINILIFFLV